MLVGEQDGNVRIGTLKGLPFGGHVVMAKVVVVTRVDSRGRDSAFAEFSLQCLGAVDTAWTTLWHSSEPGALQPADTVSMHLAVRRLRRGSGPTTTSAKVYCRARVGILELRDLVITAINVGSVTVS
jgi:hypothetical protein